VELWKTIEHFFPELLALLKSRKDHRHQSYIDYKNHVILLGLTLPPKEKAQTRESIDEKALVCTYRHVFRPLKGS